MFDWWVSRLLDFYFKKYVKAKNVIRKVDIDFEMFNNLIKKSLLIDVMSPYYSSNAIGTKN